MSIPPSASTVRWTSRSRSAAFVRSPRTGRPPIRSASRSSSSRRRANIDTLAPSAASDSAIARPIPDEAPQTIAVRPLSSRSMSLRRVFAAAEHTDDVAHGRGRLLEGRKLRVREVELDHLLDPLGTELDRHADVQPLDPVLALEIRGTGKHALLVEQDGVDYLGRSRPGCVPGGGSE